MYVTNNYTYSSLTPIRPYRGYYIIIHRREIFVKLGFGYVTNIHVYLSIQWNHISHTVYGSRLQLTVRHKYTH